MGLPCKKDDCDDSNWVPYKDRPEWQDVEPLPQDDTEYPVARIAYTNTFRDVFDYFRAVFKKKEISERAFELTADAVACNPSNYTVWHYRRLLLKELKKDINEELQYIGEIMQGMPKIYQLWHHRQVMVEWAQDPSLEKSFTEIILAKDDKNYHAWQHRLWVIKTFNLWDGEIDFVSNLITYDVRNNSAWNQRYNVVSHNLNDNVLNEEIRYTTSKISLAPNNESPWNYLRGLLQGRNPNDFPELMEFIDQLYEEGCHSLHLLHFIIDKNEAKMLSSPDKELLYKTVQICIFLGKSDPIRKFYWSFVGRNLIAIHGTCDGLSEEDNAFLKTM